MTIPQSQADREYQKFDSGSNCSVNTRESNYDSFEVYRLTIDSTPVALQLTDKTSGRLLAKNTGTVDVYLGYDGTATSTKGFTLSPGDTFEIYSSVLDTLLYIGDAGARLDVWVDYNA